MFHDGVRGRDTIQIKAMKNTLKLMEICHTGIVNCLQSNNLGPAVLRDIRLDVSIDLHDIVLRRLVEDNNKYWTEKQQGAKQDNEIKDRRNEVVEFAFDSRTI